MAVAADLCTPLTHTLTFIDMTVDHANAVCMDFLHTHWATEQVAPHPEFGPDVRVSAIGAAVHPCS